YSCKTRPSFRWWVSGEVPPTIKLALSSALISMFESMALAAPGTIDALVAMQSSFDVDSTVTTHRLVEVRKNYFIPPEYELHAPLLGERPYDAFSNGFSLSTDALEAGLRFPLHLM
ncbi:hypothetical protein GW17_00050870, partial [Ensete ventricosum]